MQIVVDMVRSIGNWLPVGCLSVSYATYIYDKVGYATTETNYLQKC